ncbi:MAG: signal recognition particle protein [Chloroflexi bacterium]|uniref:Signal recognition particle protein n=1 Tax=Candidatus Thermofonsia Clade 3 bacterium TaxID=2364212 RepID=A0A2M8QD75_9CHLR|nr:MAG: signal recognition particle protein [Candidatus Thermofonsia Clade 3 bacterium]RMG61834.1 MAG: signal recognition particle protein [Chloroflexota bacterium]
MMFESLSDKLQAIFDRLGKRGILTEQDVDAALREVRVALLEADVNFRVAKEFLARVRERAIGAEVHKSLTPGQAVVKIVHEELLKTLGEGGKLDLGGPPPRVIMLVGLQGSGKTTTAAKLALRLRSDGRKPLLVAADTYRPAAITQLETLGKQINIPVFSEGDKTPPPQIAQHAVQKAIQGALDVIIIDTAGRLQMDEAMMREVEEIKARVKPAEVLLVADAMTGQEAVNIAEAFNKRVGLTGLILTKIDGDARGGAAISMRAVTGVPIKFLSTGEKPDALEVFHPDRLASRILGMGDVLTLIEKAQQQFDEQEAAKAAEKMLSASFDLEDFLSQMRQIKRMGPLNDLLALVPGMKDLTRQISPEMTERQFKRVEAMISSMTREERRNPNILNASRKRRIAKGSGTSVQELNQLLSQFREAQRMMKQLANNPRLRMMSGWMGARRR